MRSSVLRLRAERNRNKRRALSGFAVLLCLFLAGCGNEKPDFSRDSVRTATDEALTSGTTDGTTDSGSESESRPESGEILTADPDAGSYTPYY